MRQALAQQFGTVHKACANLMPNPKRITPADLVSAMRRIEFCSEDEARRIFQRLDVKLRGVLSAGEIAGEEAETSERPAAAPVLSEMMNLAQGNEDVIRRVTDLASANAELKRQLSLQADEVISLEADSRKQRDLFLDYEQQMTAHMEKVRTEAQQDAEVKLQQAIVRAKKDAEEDCKKQIREAQEAQQEANQQIAALQEKCETLDKRGPRVDALEMELRLVRERLERETEGRRIAEDKTKESENNYSQLQAHMGKLQRDNDELHRKLEEQTELANFHKEVSGDLQGRMDDVALQAEMRVRKERGKKEAIQRLEHILPREILLKAMS
jgi:chromosome segregation ATPase